MYSLVLMMAMTTPADVPEFGGRGGCAGANSCDGGGFLGLRGGRGRGDGCNGGGFLGLRGGRGGDGCNGGGFLGLRGGRGDGCHGGGFLGLRNRGGNDCGCCGTSAASACCGGRQVASCGCCGSSPAVITTAPPVAPPAKMPEPPVKKP